MNKEDIEKRRRYNKYKTYFGFKKVEQIQISLGNTFSFFNENS